MYKKRKGLKSTHARARVLWFACTPALSLRKGEIDGRYKIGYRKKYVVSIRMYFCCTEIWLSGR